MKIMIGYDGSEVAEDALSLAKKHAKALNAEIEVVNVIPMTEESSVPKEKNEKAEEVLNNAKKILQEVNIPCNTHVLARGLEAGEILVNFAKENEIDGIVIGVKKRSSVGKMLFGSTAQYIILQAPCPVVTVR